MAWTRKLELKPSITPSTDYSTEPIVELLNATAAAAFLGINRMTFHKSLQNGSLPKGVVIGSRMYWNKALLATYVNKLFDAKKNPL